MVFLGQPAGHDADHARVPAPLGKHEGRIVGLAEALVDLLLRGKLHAPFQRLAAAVELVNVLGQLQGPIGAIGDEQLDAQLGLGQPAGGVQPRGQRETDVLAVQTGPTRSTGYPVAVGLGLDLCQLHERRQAQRRAAGETLQPVVYEYAVLVHQRHHVGHRAQGRQTNRLYKKIPHPRTDPLRPAGLLAEGPGQLEGHARTAQPAEGIIAGQLGVDDACRLGEFGADGVVVGDDQFQPALAGDAGLLHAADAAIDGDHQGRPAAAPRLHGLAVQAVALVNAVRHVIADLGPQQLQAEIEHGGARHAVHVVVAIDHDPPLGLDDRMDPLGGLAAAGQGLGIVEVRELGVEERAGLGRIGDAAADQQLGDHVRHARRALQGGDPHGVVGTNVPVLGHGERSVVILIAGKNDTFLARS